MMLWKCCTQYTNKFGKLSSGHRTGKGQFSFQSQRKAMPKNAQTPTWFYLSHTLVKQSSKFSKPSFNSTLSRNVWQEDSYVLSLMSPLSLFKRNSTLLPGTEVIVWGRLRSPLVNILFRTKLLSLVLLSWDMDCLLILWLTLPLVPLVTVALSLVFWSLSFPKEVSCTTAYIYS